LGKHSRRTNEPIQGGEMIEINQKGVKIRGSAKTIQKGLKFIVDSIRSRDLLDKSNNELLDKPADISTGALIAWLHWYTQK
jgi:hypothetical protein